MLGFLAAIALQAALAEAPGCSIDRAVYRLRGAAQFTAGFARQDRRNASASDLAFWLKTPSRLLWFSLGSPNGYGGTHLYPGLDPRQSARLGDEEQADAASRIAGDEPLLIPLDAFGADLDAYSTPPQSSDPAPAYLFSRGLGSALWYDPAELAGDVAAQPESMPIAMFERAGCTGPPGVQPAQSR